MRLTGKCTACVLLYGAEHVDPVYVYCCGMAFGLRNTDTVLVRIILLRLRLNLRESVNNAVTNVTKRGVTNQGHAMVVYGVIACR